MSMRDYFVFFSCSFASFMAMVQTCNFPFQLPTGYKRMVSTAKSYQTVLWIIMTNEEWKKNWKILRVSSIDRFSHGRGCKIFSFWFVINEIMSLLERKCCHSQFFFLFLSYCTRTVWTTGELITTLWSLDWMLIFYISAAMDKGKKLINFLFQFKM